jgi:hypothetical protein
LGDAKYQLCALVSYPRGKSPWYTLNRRVCGPRRGSGHFGVEKNLLLLLDIAQLFLSHPASSIVATLTTLFTLPMKINVILLNRNHLISLKTKPQAFLETIVDALPHYILTFS